MNLTVEQVGKIAKYYAAILPYYESLKEEQGPLYEEGNRNDLKRLKREITAFREVTPASVLMHLTPKLSRLEKECERKIRSDEDFLRFAGNTKGGLDG